MNINTPEDNKVEQKDLTQPRLRQFAIQNQQINEEWAERKLKEHLNNPGGTTVLEHDKFHPKFKPNYSWVEMSEDGDLLAIQSNHWVVRNHRGKVLKTGTGPNNIKSNVFDLIYIKKIRSFFIYKVSPTFVFKLSLDDLEPELWMSTLQDYDIPCAGKQIRGALKGNIIVVGTSLSELTLIEIKDDGTKGREVVSDFETQYLIQFEIGGENEDILITLNKGRGVNKQLQSCRINEDLTVEIFRKFSLGIGNPFSIAISSSAKYCFVHTCNGRGNAWNQYIISIDEANMELCGRLNLLNEKTSFFNNSLNYLKTVGDELIFKAIPFTAILPSRVITFIYNKKTREFKELKKHRKFVEDTQFNKLARQGDALYSIGRARSKLLILN